MNHISEFSIVLPALGFTFNYYRYLEKQVFNGALWCGGWRRCPLVITVQQTRLNFYCTKKEKSVCRKDSTRPALTSRQWKVFFYIYFLSWGWENQMCTQAENCQKGCAKHHLLRGMFLVLWIFIRKTHQEFLSNTIIIMFLFVCFFDSLILSLCLSRLTVDSLHVTLAVVEAVFSWSLTGGHSETFSS